MNNKKSAFTLVEIIIAIVIIGIMTTIGFVSYTNYIPDSRDVSRLESLGEIKKTMDIYRMKSNLPIPDRKVDIQINGVVVSYQGYLSDIILDNIDYGINGKNRGRDPKDKEFYTYYLTKDQKRFELMGFLENKNTKITLYNNVYADNIDYSKRFPVFYGDTLGIITESGSNTPIQEVTNIQNLGYINFTGSLIGDYNLGFKNNEITTSNDIVILTNKIKESLKISTTLVTSTLTNTGCSSSISDINGISTALSESPYINWVRSSTPGTCTWDCKPGYTWNGSLCVNSRTFTCSPKPVIGTEWNTVPSYTQTWNGTSWLPADTTSEYNVIPSINECRYKCISGYYWNGSSCIASTQTASCTGLPTNAVWNTVNSITQTWNGTSWTPNNNGTYNSNPSTTECRFICNTNYTWNGTSCIADSRIFVCNNKPANSSWNTVSGYIQSWNGSIWSPIDDTDTNYDTTGSTSSCRYNCNSGYYNSGNLCLSYVNGSCTNLPTGAWYYGNTTTYTLVNAPNLTPLSATTAGYNATPTTNTCEFKCETGYYWNGTSCLAYVNGACTGIPGNAKYYNGSTSYTLVNAPNGTSLTASYIANPTINTCQFNCNTGYYWNGTACASQWTGDATNGYTFKDDTGTSKYPLSCYDLLVSSNPNFKIGTNPPWNGSVFTTGNYYIDTDGAGAIAPFKAYCDMATDGGGYTYYPVAAGISTSSYSANNSCKALGMDMVVPRTKNHWLAMFNLYGSTYFATVPGIYGSVVGNYSTCIMRDPKSYGTGCNDWKAVGGGKWWIRDSVHTEPNGNYTAGCRLGITVSSYTITTTTINNGQGFDDNACAFATSKYICSTNDKSYVDGYCTNLPENAWYNDNSNDYYLTKAPDGTPLNATIAGYNATPTANTCEYKCASGSYWNGTSCLTYVNGACTGLPAYAIYFNNTTSYTLVNAPNGTSLSASYNAVPTTNTCQFKCQAGYYWSGSACLLQQWTGDATNGYNFINTSAIPTYPQSCYKLLVDTNFRVTGPGSPWNGTAFTSGNYFIDTDGAGAIAPFKAYCDMTTDGGGYTYYPVAAGISTSSYSANNSCKALGMDMVVPRTKAHWLAMFNLYGATYFTTLPGVYTTVPGNYTTCIMRDPKSYGTGCNNWKAIDGGKWWVRDSTYTEPSGDYTAGCRLQVTGLSTTAINNGVIVINDYNCTYSTTKYICSTNDKSPVNGTCNTLPANTVLYNNTTSYTLADAPEGTPLNATTAGYNATPTANTCEYKCASGSYWNGTSCLTYVNGACNSLPENSLFYNNTTNYNLVNAPNGTTLVATTAGYNATPVNNTCQYKCAPGYGPGAGGTCEETLTITNCPTVNAARNGTTPTKYQILLNVNNYIGCDVQGYPYKIAGITYSGSVIAANKMVLLVDTADEPITYAWGMAGTDVTTLPNTSTTHSIPFTTVEGRDGLSNTSNIISFFNSNSVSGAAEHICSSKTGGGLSWYMPSIEELNQMYCYSNVASTAHAYYGAGSTYANCVSKGYISANIGALPGYSAVWYRSTSEVNSTQVWALNFSNGRFRYDHTTKTEVYKIRCVSRF